MNWGDALSVIGGVTGVAGVVVAILAYKRTTEAKAIDLRLEFGRSVESVRQELISLRILVKQADSTKNATAAMLGALKSGMMAAWSQQVKSDNETINALSSELELIEKTRLGSSFGVLTSVITRVYAIQATVKRVRERYERSVAESERMREEHNRFRGAVNPGL